MSCVGRSRRTHKNDTNNKCSLCATVLCFHAPPHFGRLVGRCGDDDDDDDDCVF